MALTRAQGESDSPVSRAILHHCTTLKHDDDFKAFLEQSDSDDDVAVQCRGRRSCVSGNSCTHASSNLKKRTEQAALPAITQISVSIYSLSGELLLRDRISPDASTLQLRRAVTENAGQRAGQEWTLLLNGTALQDGLTLAESGLFDGAVISAVLQPSRQVKQMMRQIQDFVHYMQQSDLSYHEDWKDRQVPVGWKPPRAGLLEVARLGVAAAPALPLFEELLDHPHPGVVHVALWSLGSLRTAAAPAAAKIQACLDHSCSRVAAEAASVLIDLGTLEVPQIRPLLAAAVGGINHDGYAHAHVRIQLLGFLLNTAPLLAEPEVQKALASGLFHRADIYNLCSKHRNLLRRHLQQDLCEDAWGQSARNLALRLAAATAQSGAKQLALYHKLNCLCHLSPHRYIEFAVEIQKRTKESCANEDGTMPSSHRKGKCCKQHSELMCLNLVSSYSLWRRTDSVEGLESMTEKFAAVQALRAANDLISSSHVSGRDANATPFAPWETFAASGGMLNDLFFLNFGVLASETLAGGKSLRRWGSTLRRGVHQNLDAVNVSVEGEAAWRLLPMDVIARDEVTEQQEAVMEARSKRIAHQEALGKAEIREQLRQTRLKLRLYKRLGNARRGSLQRDVDVLAPWLFPSKDCREPSDISKSCEAGLCGSHFSGYHACVRQRKLPACCRWSGEQQRHFDSVLQDALKERLE